MKEARDIMGMPIAVEVLDDPAAGIVAGEAVFKKVFDYFTYVDEKFSTYKGGSEIEMINDGKLAEKNWSEDMKTIFALSEKTKQETHGYFEIKKADGRIDPSGIVKGWSILKAAEMIAGEGFRDFYVDAGGDIEARGKNTEGKKWRVGIKNPWNEKENVKVLYLSDQGIATSGTYIRGLHIYNPKRGHEPARGIMSLTVVGPNVYEADRFATAAFAMGREGIDFIESLPGFEGYMIDEKKIATMTSDFEKYTKED